MAKHLAMVLTSDVLKQKAVGFCLSVDAGALRNINVCFFLFFFFVFFCFFFLFLFFFLFFGFIIIILFSVSYSLFYCSVVWGSLSSIHCPSSQRYKGQYSSSSSSSFSSSSSSSFSSGIEVGTTPSYSCTEKEESLYSGDQIST